MLYLPSNSWLDTPCVAPYTYIYIIPYIYHSKLINGAFTPEYNNTLFLCRGAPSGGALKGVGGERKEDKQTKPYRASLTVHERAQGGMGMGMQQMGMGMGGMGMGMPQMVCFPCPLDPAAPPVLVHPPDRVSCRLLGQHAVTVTYRGGEVTKFHTCRGFLSLTWV